MAFLSFGSWLPLLFIVILTFITARSLLTWGFMLNEITLLLEFLMTNGTGAACTFFNQINSFLYENFNMIKLVRIKTIIHLTICWRQIIWFDNSKWHMYIQCLQPTWECLALVWLVLEVSGIWTSHSPLWPECKSTLGLTGICSMIFWAEVMHCIGV